MSAYVYLDVSLQLKTIPSDPILPVFVKGGILTSLEEVFGEVGGCTTVDVLKFDPKSLKLILRVPKEDYVKVRTALTLIAKFQEIPCRFHVNCVSPVLLSLVRCEDF
ncbi:ribonuclease P protein subunit p14-like [Lutzomyia longipalpis]|uniref:ribonuclease P protein subunit p14-like n=1 Tax=Lutzomyia longipalpis TaxID=7200 RepID=UPI002483838D|nr:ribonuclease P protein subunit p14-like [Lutzomyia longipalpis]